MGIHPGEWAGVGPEQLEGVRRRGAVCRRTRKKKTQRWEWVARKAKHKEAKQLPENADSLSPVICFTPNTHAHARTSTHTCTQHVHTYIYAQTHSTHTHTHTCTRAAWGS